MPEKIDKIKTALLRILADHNPKYYEKYKSNFSLKNDNLSFTLEIEKVDLEFFKDLNFKIKNELKKIKWIKNVDFILTSHLEPKFRKNFEKKVAKFIVPVASGKGGVGKSTTALNIALSLKKLGKNVGILDADIYGPSLPKLLGINEAPRFHEKNFVPHFKFGIQSMSVGYLIPEEKPTIWRGPMVMSAINQLLNNVLWKNLDYLIVDMPPGTGDAQLTLSQKTEIDGVIIVSTPQDLSLLDAKKGLNMFSKINVPIIGMVENMSFFECNSCLKKHFIFGKDGVKNEAKKLKIPLLGQIPIDIKLMSTSDIGEPFLLKYTNSFISKTYIKVSKKIIKILENNK